MAGLIPELVLASILKKLPVKALLNCRCVCKSWNSLITSPFFIKTHYTAAQKSHLLVKCFSRIETKVWCTLFQPQNTLFPLIFPFTSRSSHFPFEIVGSVYGILCLVDGVDCNLIILWNPMINKHIKLPMPKITSSLAFAGLGFDNLLNDFKVVRLAYTGYDVNWIKIAQAEIWSLEHPMWRVLPVNEDLECSYMAKPGSPAFFMNGFIHWLAVGHPTKRGMQKSQNAVLLFDVEKESFQTLGLPDELRYTELSSVWLSKFGLSLALLYFDCRLHPNRCVIWVMSEYGVEESWTKMISTDLQLGVENKSWVRELWTNMVTATNESELSTASYDHCHDYSKVFGLHYEKGESVASVDTFTESLVMLDVEMARPM